ncbi:hypothetical protein LTR47_011919 [Exophiala xenobiotica]|nr:hypothetical protein LTR47_011919 [Exophiala xenobiotica]KAK5353018.1 hypothetical protein LTR11_011956 [Exophiala xenobiotica]
MTAAIATLDEEHQQISSQDKSDSNNYVLGRIHKHNVVIASLPAGVYGTNAAARVANDMLRTFTGLRFGLMVGIGGGIPNLSKDLDIRLGDVVMSQPDKTFGGLSKCKYHCNWDDNIGPAVITDPVTGRRQLI